MTPTTLSPLTEAAADPQDALRHFERLLAFETDCSDVHAAMADPDPGFVLVDVRSADQFQAAHIPGAVNLPYRQMDSAALASYPADTLFVVYCNGQHCNGADRGAVRLAGLGRKVKKMIGGIQGWKSEGYRLV